jgi:hypothetical protein
MNKEDIKSKDYKYILIDRSDPELMWNCAVSIIVFVILFFFLYMNWKPKCKGDTAFDEFVATVDASSIADSLTNLTTSSNTRIV